MDISTVPDLVLDQYYRLPAPMRSKEDYERALHLDLAALSALDIDLETIRVKERLSYDDDPAHVAWLVARLNAIDTETQRRADAERQCRPDEERARHAEDAPAAITWGPLRPAQPSRPGLIVRRNGKLIEL